MPMFVGHPREDEGMAMELFQAMEAVLRPPLSDPPDDGMGMSDEEIEPIEENWERLSLALAQGVVRHLRRDPPPASPSSPLHAESVSSAVEDEEFWAWFAAFVGAFDEWSSQTGAGGNLAALRTRLANVFQDHNTPTSLRGVLE